MRLIGKDRLVVIQNINGDIDVWISAWVAEINHATWKADAELIDAFPRVKAVDGSSYMFPVLGNEEISIKVSFSFSRGIAVIREVISK